MTVSRRTFVMSLAAMGAVGLPSVRAWAQGLAPGTDEPTAAAAESSLRWNSPGSRWAPAWVSA